MQPKITNDIGLTWFRRDLRLHDHPALKQCIASHKQTYCVFVFDSNIIDPLRRKDPTDKRIQFIAESIHEINETLKQYQSSIIILYGDPIIEIPKLAHQLNINTVYFNRDYSPYPLKRDESVKDALIDIGVNTHTSKDHVIFEPHEILTQKHQPYHVFTPYCNQWLSRLDSLSNASKDIDLKTLAPQSNTYKSLESILKFIGFQPTTSMVSGGSKAAQKMIASFTSHISDYHIARDFPYPEKTSKISVYLRHGCISIRDLVKIATSSQSRGSEIWLKELVWREFYQSIVFHYPHVKESAFKPAYNSIPFKDNKMILDAWKKGQTGFPIIDAAMRCLNQTGWMHNRLRMLCASFLCKLGMIHWKHGERYFAWKLLDYEFASNNGGWQWAAGTGCDAAPYFRIFNPTTQSKKYDPDGKFIKQYCPELTDLTKKDIHCPSDASSLPQSVVLGTNYPNPIIDYSKNRQECLELYKQNLSNS